MIWWLLLNRGMIPNWFIILKSTPRLTKLSQWVRGGARWLLVRIMFTMQAQRSGDKMLWDEATDRDTDQDKMPLQVTCWLALLRREGKLTSDYLVLSPYWRHQASHWPLLTAPLDDINDQMILPNHASPQHGPLLWLVSFLWVWSFSKDLMVLFIIVRVMNHWQPVTLTWRRKPLEDNL